MLRCLFRSLTRKRAQKAIPVKAEGGRIGQRVKVNSSVVRREDPVASRSSSASARRFRVLPPEARTLSLTPPQPFPSSLQWPAAECTQAQGRQMAQSPPLAESNSWRESHLLSPPAASTTGTVLKRVRASVQLHPLHLRNNCINLICCLSVVMQNILLEYICSWE